MYSEDNHFRKTFQQPANLMHDIWKMKSYTHLSLGIQEVLYIWVK